ncbi:RidA family protein [Candidatus Latescibacterota bacterium]
MKHIIVPILFTVFAVSILIAGCGVDEVAVREIASEEAQRAIEQYSQSFVPEKFGFGVPWETEFSYAQGVKTGNMIFIAGQLAHGQTPDADGNVEFFMGNFEEQFRATLENVKAVLANYGATMDDVVFLQNFVDPEAGTKRAGDYNPVAAKLIREYFPNGLHAMTFAEVTNLYGPEQLVESNAIAVVRK